MEKSWELFKEFDDGSIYVKGEKAIKFTYGYSTGAELGAHNFLNSFALAEVGSVDCDGEFQADVYLHDNAPNREMVGRPKEYEGWNPAGGTVDWGDYDRWVEQVLEAY